MEFSAVQLLGIASIIFVAGVIQSAVGFAGGLFGIPLLVMIGMSLPEAVMTSLIGSFIQCVMSAYQMRRELDPRTTIRPALLRLVTIPLGLYVQGQITVLDDAQVKQIVGMILLGIVIAQKAWRVEPRQQLHPAWEYLALSLSGFMAGLCGMGGPAMILWVMAHDWSAKKSRAFMFFVFSAGMLPQALLLWWKYGRQMLIPTVLGLLGVLITIAGTHVGLRIGHGFSKRRLRRLVEVILLFIATTAMLAPWLPEWSR